MPRAMVALGPGKIDYREFALAQQEAVLDGILIYKRPYNIASGIDPEGGAGPSSRRSNR